MFDFIGLGNGLINVALLIVFLLPLVLIHELGHFLVARRARVTVHEFGVGFPPRAKVLGTDSQGTEYTLNWLPIGGFVRMEGEEGRSADPNAFINKGLGTRLLILLAGVTMNLVLAFVVFAGIAGFADPTVGAQVLQVQPGSPAEQAGLLGGQQVDTTPDGIPIYDNTGDKIIAVDGHYFAALDDPSGRALTDYMRARPSTTITLTVQHHDGSITEMPATTRSAADIAAGKGALGFSVGGALGPNVQHGPVDAVVIGFHRTVDAALLIFRGISDFVHNLGNPPISGPVGVVDAIGQVRGIGSPVFLIYLFGLLSANLAVVNALPFPPLDGGRVAVALLQKVTGDRISVAAERLAYLTGFVLLMALLAYLTLFDTGVFQRQV
ncbi:MAG: M50 family metallopeptidase [Candidatus Limnocylindrales bacterium]